jgi:hypothetical protein
MSFSFTFRGRVLYASVAESALFSACSFHIAFSLLFFMNISSDHSGQQIYSQQVVDLMLHVLISLLNLHWPDTDSEQGGGGGGGAAYFGELEEALVHQVATLRRRAQQTATTTTSHHGHTTRTYSQHHLSLSFSDQEQKHTT